MRKWLFALPQSFGSLFLLRLISFLLLADLYGRRAGAGGGIVAMWPAGQPKPWTSALQQVQQGKNPPRG
jgi:hypothetical protein